MDWTKETHSLSWLRAEAINWDWYQEMSGGDFETDHTMLNFLRFAGVLPIGVEWNRGNAIPKTNLDGNSIPAGYLAEVAFDYDKDGYSTASDFIDMLEFEVAGTSSNDVLGEVMADLGRDI